MSGSSKSKKTICLATGSFYTEEEGDDINKYSRMCNGLDIDGVELTFAIPEAVDDFNPGEETLNFIKSLSFNTIHAPWMQRDGTRITYEEKELPFISRMEKVAKRINAKYIAMHIFRPAKFDFIQGNEIKYCFENLMKGHEVPFSDYRKLLVDNPGIKLCLDTTHALTISQRELVGLIREFRKDIAYVHLSGNDLKTGKRHKPVSLLSSEELAMLEPVKPLELPFVIEVWAGKQKDRKEFVRNEVGFVREWLG